MKILHSCFIQKIALLTSLVLLIASSAVHAQQSNISNRLIVKYRDNVPLMSSRTLNTDAMNNMSRRAGEPLQHVRQMAIGAQVVRLARSANVNEVQAVVDRLRLDPNVEWAEVDYIKHPTFVPNDTFYNDQWHYFEATGGLNLPDAWDVTTGEGAIVAVLDTGILAHEDLIANTLPGYDMISDSFVARDGGGRDADPTDPGDWMLQGECGTDIFGNPIPSQDRDSSWHGSHVAGTVAAVSDNNQGGAGVAFGAQILPVRVLGRCGGLTSDISDAIIWAAGGTVPGIPNNPNPADVINMSLGGDNPCTSAELNAINTARGLGATVIAAAGNSNVNANNHSPSSCAGVIAVAATDRDGGKAFYSNFGSSVDVAAPGGDVTTCCNGEDGVLSTIDSGTTSANGDVYAYYQGTSMASPHVAGAAALLYSVNPAISPDDVESILETTARSFPGTCNQCGAGIVDATAAVAAAQGGGGGNELENGVPVTSLSGGDGSERRYTLDVPAGASNLSIAISGGSGDADLYVRFNQQPSLDDWDCRPFIGGNNETCDITNVQTGTYHVLIHGFDPYSGLTLLASFTEGGGPPPSGGSNVIDWSSTPTVSYSNQDASANVSVEDGGDTLLLQQNTWRRTTDFSEYTVNANTMIEFDFRSTDQGEIHGIGIDGDNDFSNNQRLIQIYGTQNWSGVADRFTNNGYSGSGSFEHFQINVGAYYTGSGALVIANDDDAGPSSNSRFRNVQVRQCSRIDDFENNNEGWTANAALSTCSTGSFVRGTPSEIVSSGVTTQLGGDHSRGDGSAFFTQPNSSAGNADVDGGVCVADSPLINLSEDSDVSLWYYHGQRDAGDDSGDFFSLEASIDGGSYSPIATYGDEQVNAQWQQASVPLSAGQSIRFRVRVADGTGGGDLIEAGVDDVVVCPSN